MTYKEEAQIYRAALQSILDSNPSRPRHSLQRAARLALQEAREGGWSPEDDEPKALAWSLQYGTVQIHVWAEDGERLYSSSAEYDSIKPIGSQRERALAELVHGAAEIFHYYEIRHPREIPS